MKAAFALVLLITGVFAASSLLRSSPSKPTAARTSQKDRRLRNPAERPAAKRDQPNPKKTFRKPRKMNRGAKKIPTPAKTPPQTERRGIEVDQSDPTKPAKKPALGPSQGASPTIAEEPPSLTKVPDPTKAWTPFPGSLSNTPIPYYSQGIGIRNDEREVFDLVMNGRPRAEIIEALKRNGTELSPALRRILDSNGYGDLSDQPTGGHPLARRGNR